MRPPELPWQETEQTTLWDKVVIWLLALCPLLQHYKAVFDNAATVTLVVVLCYFGIKLLCKKQWRIGFILPLLLMSAYEIFNHGISLMVVAREALLAVCFIAAASGVVDLKYFRKVTAYIAMLASALVVIQYICYYVLGFHLQLVPTALLDSSAEQWVKLAQTGRISVTGNVMRFYRPSAFFLEPSHIALYSFPALASVIMAREFGRKHVIAAIMLSAGAVLATSGMGIAMVIGLWGVWLIKHLAGKGGLREKLQRLMKPKSLIWLGAVLAVLFSVYFFVEPFRLSINRIFYSPDGKNAIEGRMGSGIRSVQSLSGFEFWFGKRVWGSVHNRNMAGFFYVFFTQGFVGMLLSYGFYFNSLFRAKGAGFWITAVVIGLSLVTVHTHAAFYMLFYVMIIMGYYPLENDKLMIPNVLYNPMKRLRSCAVGLQNKSKNVRK